MASILVIDDDASLLQMMSIMLKRAGHEPILARSGQSGLDLARSRQPDVAIVDVMMPDLTGYEVCRMLRADPVTMDIPLLILTALSQPEQREKAEDAGADEFVTKPVTRDDLITAVELLLSTGARNIPSPDEPIPSPVDEYVVPRTPAPEPEPSPPPPSPPAPELPELDRPITDIMMEVDQPPKAPAAPPTPAQAPAPAGGRLLRQALPLIAVMGLGRGVGATTLAVNLSLGVMQHGRSCIVDLNNMGGQVAVQLRMMPPRSSWTALLGMSPGSDKRRIGAALTAGHQSGVAMLAAPLNPSPDHLTGETLQFLFEVLSEGFKRVVVDLPANLTGAMTLATLRRARHVVLVVGDNPGSLLGASGELASIKELGLPGEIHLVLNHTEPGGLKHEEVVRALNRPLDADVPFEAAQQSALAQGIPLVMSQPRSLFSQTILRLARQL